MHWAHSAYNTRPRDVQQRARWVVVIVVVLARYEIITFIVRRPTRTRTAPLVGLVMHTWSLPCLPFFLLLIAPVLTFSVLVLYYYYIRLAAAVIILPWQAFHVCMLRSDVLLGCLALRSASLEKLNLV